MGTYRTLYRAFLGVCGGGVEMGIDQLDPAQDKRGISVPGMSVPRHFSVGRVEKAGRAGRISQWLRAIESRPQAANRVVLGAWLVTRLILLAGILLGHNYCDPEFYHYAGMFASGHWPYHDFPVEYPPVTMVLLLLPALPLLPFSALAPRPVAAFLHPSLAQLPQPDPVRYGAYGISFAVEMLVIDALTLWLVRRVARKLLPGDPQGLRASLLYIALIFVNGSLLQKFDLASGTLCLLALAALLAGRVRIAWGTVALAALVKGFPALVLVAFVGYTLYESRRVRLLAALRASARQLVTGATAFGVVVACWTLLVVAVASWQTVMKTVSSQASRPPEVESLYGNALLVLGWLPSLTVRTMFHKQDLSRVVLSSLGSWIDLVSHALLAGCVLAVCLTFWRALDRVRGGWRPVIAPVQFVAIGAAALLLAFVLTFLALPVHYLLVVAPLAAIIRLPRRQLQRLWIGSLFAVSLFGQVIVRPDVWYSLVILLQPWAVLLLSLRNIAWVMAFVVLLVALFHWPRKAQEAPEWE